MSAPPTSSGAPITGKRQLVEYLEAGCKPREAWSIGTEHEKFVFRRAGRRPVSYDEPNGIGALLRGFTRFGWEPVLENGNPIALKNAEGASISLEPGGQLELSGAPFATVHETDAELKTHAAQSAEVADELGLGMLAMGFAPTWRRDEISWMPKGRYRIMREYMPKRGSLGLDMMLRTCTVQVNLDFASEADMVQKYRVSLALQSVATALFAASPFTEGRPNGFESFRSHIWTDTDPDRSGVPAFVFEDGFGFERYVDYLLDMPMYFVYRDGRYVDASGQSFRDFMAGRLPARPGEIPGIGDWADHVTIAFPEVRLKRYLEMRGADSGPLPRLAALPALWVGLLYDQTALDAAANLTAGWTVPEMQKLRLEAPRYGLATPWRGGTIRDVAGPMVEIARAGLRRRAKLDAGGADEARYLDPLDEIVRSGRSPARDLLDRFHGPWGGRIDPIFDELSYFADLPR